MIPAILSFSLSEPPLSRFDAASDRRSRIFFHVKGNFCGALYEAVSFGSERGILWDRFGYIPDPLSSECSRLPGRRKSL